MKTHKNPLRRMLGLILCLSMLVSLALPALGAAPTTETPKTPTAASDFHFDASTGTIDRYTGSDTDRRRQCQVAGPCFYGLQCYDGGHSQHG